MEIIEKEIGELSEYENNSRTHSDEQIQQIIASINEFGFTNPLLINPDNRIIAGHGRLRAAIEIGLKKVPCIILSDLTSDQERAYVIADNNIALQAGWDFEMLKFEIKDLKDVFDLKLLAFDDASLSLLTGNDIEQLKKKNIDTGEDEYLVVVYCDNESHQKIIFDEMQTRKQKVKIV